MNIIKFSVVMLVSLEALIHFQAQSYNLISCYGNSVEQTNESASRV